MKITCLGILFKKILPSDCSTSKAFEVKTVQFSELLDWQLTRTVKMKKSEFQDFFFLSDITYAADSESIGTNTPIGAASFQTLLRGVTNAFA